MNVAGLRGQRKGISGSLVSCDIGGRVRIRRVWREMEYRMWVNDVHEAIGLVDPILIVVWKVQFIVRLGRTS